MKKFLAIVMVLLATSASADFCNSTLKDRNGWVMRTFSGFGYTMNEACSDARMQCQWEKERNSWNNRFRGSYCEVERRQQPTKKKCEFKMIKGNGNEITSFSAQGQSKQMACEKAQRQCSRDLRQRQRQGRNMRATCVRARGGYNDAPRVTRSCSVTRVNARGRVVQVHTRSATARNGAQAQQQACSDARMSCSNNARAAQRCIMDRRY